MGRIQTASLALMGLLFADPVIMEARAGEGSQTTSAACSKGFLAVNGIEMWHEVYGKGEPIVVLHGGLMTIPEMMPLIEPLAKSRKVIALELQGHGRTPDTDRPLAFHTLGDDVAAVIDELGLGRADVLGYSFGADTALRTAIQHPDKVRNLIVVSAPFAKRGWYKEAQEGMSAVSGETAEQLKDTPTAKFALQWPEPERFPQFLDKIGDVLSEDYDWSSEVKALPMPVMLVYADHDSVSQAHIAEFFALLGGGISEPGWQNTKFTRARLAVIPGYSHYNFMSATEIAPLVHRFSSEPIEGNASGAAPASQTAP